MKRSGPAAHDLKEAVAALSLAEDAANGNPPETALRAALLAASISDRLGRNETDGSTAFLTALLRFLGCTSFSSEEAEFFAGDEISARRLFADVDSENTAQTLSRVMKLAGARGLGAKTRLLVKGRDVFRSVAETHCETAAVLARGLGAGEVVVKAIGQVFERADGRGQPAGLRADAIEPAAMTASLAYTFEVLRQKTGTERALQEIQARSGRQFTGVEVKALCALDRHLLHPAASCWDQALDRCPGLPAADLRVVAETFADFADMKSRYTIGHSRAAAKLARSAAAVASMDEETRGTIEFAALVMNAGMAGIPGGIVDKPGRLTRPEIETIRMHTIYTERILSSAQAFGPMLHLAADHHERQDGSGYHRGRSDLSLSQSLLVCADIFTALVSQRPWRSAMNADQAAETLMEMQREGKLDPRAVSVVLQAAGQKERRDHVPRDSMGLTEREQDVLRLLGRGLTNKEIGADLGLSSRTVQHHTINIYEKLGAKGRAAAVRTAMSRGLLPV